jgi:quinolinate synthase
MFLPDFFLGHYVQSVTGRKLDIWMGECHVHAGLRPDVLAARKRELPDAEFLVHPECGCTTQMMFHANQDGLDDRTRIVSTEQMMERQGVHPGLGRRRMPLHEDDHAREPA